jgi:hypothetical protein
MAQSAQIGLGRRRVAIGPTADIGRAPGLDALVANDPSATSGGLSYCNSEARFSPFRDGQSSRYDAKGGHTAAQAAQEMIGVF